MLDNQESKELERKGGDLKQRIEKILDLDEKRTYASFTHQKTGVYPNGDNEYDAIYIKPYHKGCTTFYGKGIKRIIIQEISYEQETERGSCYLLRDVIRSADAKFISSAPEMASIIKELSKQLTTTQQALDTAVEALGLHIMADAYGSTFPDNAEDSKYLAKNETELRIRADRLLSDELREKCHKAAKDYLCNLPEHKAMVKKITDELWGKNAV